MCMINFFKLKDKKCDAVRRVDKSSEYFLDQVKKKTFLVPACFIF